MKPNLSQLDVEERNKKNQVEKSGKTIPEWIRVNFVKPVTCIMKSRWIHKNQKSKSKLRSPLLIDLMLKVNFFFF